MNARLEPKSLPSLRELQPGLRPAAKELLRRARALGRVKITSVRRSPALQARLYRRYLNGQSRYPAAPPGHSYHEIGRAFDLTAEPSVLATLGAIWESWGGRWGGRANDPIHFEA